MGIKTTVTSTGEFPPDFREPWTLSPFSMGYDIIWISISEVISFSMWSQWVCCITLYMMESSTFGMWLRSFPVDLCGAPVGTWMKIDSLQPTKQPTKKTSHWALLYGVVWFCMVVFVFLCHGFSYRSTFWQSSSQALSEDSSGERSGSWLITSGWGPVNLRVTRRCGCCACRGCCFCVGKKTELLSTSLESLPNRKSSSDFLAFRPQVFSFEDLRWRVLLAVRVFGSSDSSSSEVPTDLHTAITHPSEALVLRFRLSHSRQYGGLPHVTDAESPHQPAGPTEGGDAQKELEFW